MPFVTLVHRTEDAEKLIVKMARVSNPSNEDNWETGPRLLRYLLQHRHFSPFEMVGMCLRIETERDIAAQIIRHRSFSFQERSTRYAAVDGMTVPELRRQDTKNRQNSIDDLPEDVTAELRDRVKLLFGESSKLYNDMLEQGVAKETARRILPLSTSTTMFMHGTLRSWLHYIDVRCDPSTQLEHREIAEACKAIFTEQFPTIAEAAWST